MVTNGLQGKSGSVDDGPGVLCDARTSKFIWVLASEIGECCLCAECRGVDLQRHVGIAEQSGTALAYGTLDNCYTMDSHHHDNGERTADPRFKYSPTHSEPAVCCVPN